jgi:hypothetical protein
MKVTQIKIEMDGADPVLVQEDREDNEFFVVGHENDPNRLYLTLEAAEHLVLAIKTIQNGVSQK